MLRNTFELRVSVGVQVRQSGQSVLSDMGAVMRALLVRLASVHPEPVSRKTLVRALYPDSDVARGQVALRQLMSRIRAILGADALQSSKDRVWLPVGTWDVSFSPDASLISEFPWLQPVNYVAMEPCGIGDKFASLVLDIAALDATEARRLLISQPNMLRTIPYEVMRSLLIATNPRNRDDLYYGEFRNLEILTLLIKGEAIAPVVAKLGRVLSYSLQARKRDVYKRAKALEAFIKGDSEVYDGRVDSNPRIPEGDIYAILAHSSLLWADDQVEASARLLFKAIPQVEHETDATALHFWCNMSVYSGHQLFSDMGEEARRRAERIPLAKVDFITQRCIAISKARSLLAKGDLEGARIATAEYASISERMGWCSTERHELYSHIALAKGDLRAAQDEMNRLKRYRLGTGRSKNPRFRSLVATFDSKVSRNRPADQR